MMIRKLVLLLLICVQTTLVAQVKVGEVFPEWTEGFMDLHHINTGRGESIFAVLPDGTTLLIDAGEVTPSAGVAEARPNDRKSPGEWIARYAARMMQSLPDQKKLDYVLLTHFHHDHMGNVLLNRRKSIQGDYLVSGISEVSDHFSVGKIVDRGWPNYDWPTSLATDENVRNYIDFVNWQVAQSATAEQFKAGSNEQFVLLKDADRYPEFEIRNVAVNGQVWTGVNDEVRDFFPPLQTLSEEEFPTENQCSAAIRISYGKFDYFNGGDIINAHAWGSWQDIETPIGQVVGPVEVSKANHHGAHDAVGAPFLQAVRPRVVLLPLWSASQLEARGLQRLLAPSIYPGERDVFATNLMEATKRVLGRRAAELKSEQGHIVVRVRPGGDTFDIYILDDETEDFVIKAVHGPYESR